MNLPNKITVFRIFLIPIFMLVLSLPFEGSIHTGLGSSVSTQRLLAALIFALASFTDWLDGYIARKEGLVTNFGKFADPLADKLLTITAFIYLVELDLAPAFVVAIIAMRELAVTGLRLVLVEEGEEILAAAWPGKIKTATQMFAIIFLLIDDWPFAFLGFSLGKVLLYVSLFFTIYSGIEYFYKSRHVFKN